MKWLKRGALVLLILVVLLASALTAVALFVDPNDYTDEVVEAVREKTGRTLHIDGEIGLSVFPWIGLELNRVSLDNPEGFTDKTFAGVEKLNIKVALLPLFGLEVRVGEVQLLGLTANLERRADGVTNWDDLVEQAAEPAGPEADQSAADETRSEAGEAPAGQDKPSRMALKDFYIGGVDIRDANITWRDAASDTVARIEHFFLETDTLRLGDPAAFEGRFAARNERPKLIAGVEFSGVARANPAAQQYGLEQLQLQVKASGVQVPGKDQTVNLNLRRVSADLSEQTAVVNRLIVKAAGSTARINADAAGITGETPEVDGRFEVNVPSVRELMAYLDMVVPETADENVLGALALETAFSATPEQVALEDLKAVFDDSTLTGGMSVRDFASPAIAFDLTMDAVNADRYLPPAPGERVPAPAESPAPADVPGEPDPEIPLPMDTLRELNVDGAFSLGQLQVMNLKASTLELKVLGEDGVITADPLKLDLYDGGFNGRAIVNVTGEQPAYTADVNLADVQFGPLLDDFMEDGFVEGVADLEASVNTGGERVSELKQGLNGAFEFAVNDGALKGINIAEKLREVRARLRRESYNPPETPKKTDFAELAGAAGIEDGRVQFSKIDVASPLLRASGEGSADLVSEALDLAIDAYLVGTTTGQDGKSRDEVRDIYAPLLVKGTFTEPEIKIDWDKALGRETEAELEAKKKEAEAAVERKKEAARAELEKEKQKARAKREREEAEIERKKKEAEEEARRELERKKEEKKKELLDNLFN